jgi:hypothetical protein
VDRQRCPVAEIHSIGLGPCVDLHLKTSSARPPTSGRRLGSSNRSDGAAAARTISAYGMAFQKNGGVSVTASRNAERACAECLAGTAGWRDSWMHWDIVNALDAASPSPTPGVPASAKLASRRTLCLRHQPECVDTTHVGDSGSHNGSGPILYALNIINDIPTPP